MREGELRTRRLSRLDSRVSLIEDWPVPIRSASYGRLKRLKR